ncbi:hypothetical protein LC593_08170 [Nostoc sp. CHAB 5844]|nr:hypothetical protein [Nostoc sp. CHAB 5844]
MKKVILVGSLFAAQIVFAPAFAAPAGSYTRTCTGIEESRYYNGRQYIDRLSALCQDLQGRWVNTYLDTIPLPK